MSDFIQQFLEQLLATSLLEWIAVLLAVAYLLLAIKESQWCWPAAFVSTSIYVFLFFNVNLFMESFLNFYYLLMAVYGWRQWQNFSNNSEKKIIVRWSVLTHFYIVCGTVLMVFISSEVLKAYTTQEFAVADSFTTWFAVVATYMVTQKVLENWLYWIIINVVSIYLFLSKGLALTAILFLSYVLLAVVGWFRWKNTFERSNSQNGLKKQVGEVPC